MNFWTFLDRNAFGLFLLALAGLLFGFGTCGDGQGCKLRCEPSLSIKSAPSATDGGP